jgi:hypothetical protein
MYIQLHRESSAEASVSANGFVANQGVDDPGETNDRDSEISDDNSQSTDLFQDDTDQQLEDKSQSDGCEKEKKSQLRLELRTFERECDRHGVSDRCAASLVSAVLQDVELMTQWSLTEVKSAESVNV